MIDKLWLTFLFPILLIAYDFHDFDCYQNRFSRDEVKERIEKYLEKDSSIQKFYHITPDALYIGDKNHPDYVLAFKKTPSIDFSDSEMPKSLKGLRVALDPGHLGGEYAEIEKRCIVISDVHLHEGDMAYLTALKLKELLEGEGAIVMITRTGIGEGALGKNFDTWRTHSPQAKDPNYPQNKLFWQYNREDLYVRAENINAFHPDITLILHYNSDYLDEDEKVPLIEENYSIVFVPGAFSEHELDREKDRYEFLRLLVSDTVEQSVLLSEKIGERFVKQLKVPFVDHAKLTPKLEPYCLIQKPGIYARNLVLTRLIHSPICYGEPLVQNHVREAQLLVEKNAVIHGVQCSKRLEEVAEAYFEGIKDYCLGN